MQKETSPTIMSRVFPMTERTIFLGTTLPNFVPRRINTVYYGSESVSHLGPKLWRILLDEYKQLSSLNEFKSYEETLEDITHFKKCLENGKTPEWMIKGRICLILKHEKKENETSNFRPITCLPIMWKVFTGILGGQVYGHMEREKLLLDEQKGCRRQSKGTRNHLMINKMVIKNCKRRMRNLSVA